jgi:hypothetical protein
MLTYADVRHEQLDKYSSDSFRFYLAYASPYGQVH